MSTQTTRQPIAAHILKRAQTDPEHRAICHGSAELNYRQLAERAIAFADHCDQRLELQRKSSVALCVRNPVDLLVAFIGARLCGHHLLVLNPEWPAQTKKQCLENLQPALSLDDEDIKSFFEAHAITQQTPSDALDVWLQKADDDLHSAFYTGFTSGSEGAPKGFSRHEHSWLHSFEIDEESYQLSTSDTVLCPGKLAHSLFLYACLRGLCAGATLVIEHGVAQARVHAQLERLTSVVLFAVPAQLLSLSESKQRYNNIRLVVSAGAKLQPTQREALSQALPRAELMECYGSSELSYIALSKPDDAPPAASVGKPCAGVVIQITGPEGRALEDGQIGRILVRSPLRFIGYAEAHNKTSLREMRCVDGFLDSGDTGYLDAKGFLFITGRSDRMMSIAGHSVFPEEIEAALLSHPNITHSSVFPIDDRRRGQRAVAVVQLASGLAITRRQLMSQAAGTLPSYAIPRRYYRVHAWPSTVSDKTDVKQLKAMYHDNKLEPIR